MSDPALAAFIRAFGPEFGHGKPIRREVLLSALDELGAPHRRLPPVIHVAGTNGKGSTIAFMRAIAEAAGLSVHAFTKPHLDALRERFLVASRPVDDAGLIAAADRIAQTAPALTQFDAQVAAAMLLFSETTADLALLETGMGGRDDSTNIIDAPALSVITAIDLDHTETLGGAIAAIAAHKAGIIRPAVPVICARQIAEAEDVIAARAAALQAPLLRCGQQWDAFANAGRLFVQGEKWALDLPAPTLAGAHQIENAGLACAAMMTWRDLDQAAFARGVEAAHLPARLQALTRGALSAPIRAAGGEVWADGGHNPHAASALAQTLMQMQARRGGANVAIVGMRARKDAARFIGRLAPALERLIAIPLNETHIDPEDLALLAVEAGVAAESAASLADAMEKAARFPAPRILICGSFLLAAEALAREGA